jgi:hypothetical protein
MDYPPYRVSGILIPVPPWPGDEEGEEEKEEDSLKSLLTGSIEVFQDIRASPTIFICLILV